jgi:hypothetical protein
MQNLFLSSYSLFGKLTFRENFTQKVSSLFTFFSMLFSQAKEIFVNLHQTPAAFFVFHGI